MPEEASGAEGLREAHMGRLDQRLLPHGLGLRWPQINLDKNVLIIAIVELIPIEKLYEQEAGIFGNAIDRVVPVPRVDFAIDHKRRLFANAQLNQNGWVAAAIF